MFRCDPNDPVRLDVQFILMTMRSGWQNTKATRLFWPGIKRNQRGSSPRFTQKNEATNKNAASLEAA
jgi:hypothetical protein